MIKKWCLEAGEGVSYEYIQVHVLIVVQTV